MHIRYPNPKNQEGLGLVTLHHARTGEKGDDGEQSHLRALFFEARGSGVQKTGAWGLGIIKGFTRSSFVGLGGFLGL